MGGTQRSMTRAESSPWHNRGAAVEWETTSVPSGFRYITGAVLGVFLFSYTWDAHLHEFLNLPFIPTTLLLAPMIALFFGTLFATPGTLGTLSFPRFLLPLVALLGYASVSLLWSPVADVATIRLVYVWRFLGEAFLVYYLCRQTRLSPYALLWCYVLGVTSRGLYALFGLGLIGERFMIAEGVNPTEYAGYVAWALVACVAIFVASRRFGKFAAAVAAGPLLLSLVLSQGRNALLSLAVSLPLAMIACSMSLNWHRGVVVVRRKAARVAIYLMILLSLIGMAVAAVVISAGLVEHTGRIASMTEFFGGDRDVATANRWSIWKAYMPLVLDNALAGGGFRSASTLHGALYARPNSPHNVYILTLVELGITGLFLWTAFIWLVVKFALQERQRNIALVWLSLSFPIFGIGNDILDYRYWWIAIAIILLIAYLDRAKDSQHAVEEAQSQHLPCRGT